MVRLFSTNRTLYLSAGTLRVEVFIVRERLYGFMGLAHHGFSFPAASSTGS
jgi:hypothetical protein